MSIPGNPGILRIEKIPDRALPTVALRAPCSKLGNVVGRDGECTGCGGRPTEIRECSEFGQCTEAVSLPGLACCKACGKYEANADTLYQIVVTADGIGDHLQALCVANAWKQANPEKTLAFVAKEWCTGWVQLFEGYDRLTTAEVPDAMHAWRAANVIRAGEHFVERAAASSRKAPTPKPLPSSALEWAERYRDAVILCPFTHSPDRSREWLISHWLTLERLLHSQGRATCIIGTGHELNRAESFGGAKLFGMKPDRVAALMSVAACVISNDSGMGHLAGAYNRPTVVLSSLIDGLKVYRIWPSVNVIQAEKKHAGNWWANLQTIEPAQVLAMLRLLVPNMGVRE